MFIDFPIKFRGLSCKFSLKPIISIEQCHRHNIVTDTLAQHCRTHKQYNVVACDGVTHTKPHTTVSHTHNTVAPTHACNIVTYNIVTHTSVTHTTFSQTTVTPTHTTFSHIMLYHFHEQHSRDWFCALVAGKNDMWGTGGFRGRM